VERLRDIRKFASAGELAAQLAADRHAAEATLATRSSDRNAAPGTSIKHF
jgi:hypothetical protein